MIWNLDRIFKPSAALAALGLTAAAFGHGVITTPPSRNYICGVETIPSQVDFGVPKTPACSTAFAVNPMAAYNYMAVLTHTWGRAEVTPLPTHVCSFGSESWKGARTPWDTAMEWPASPVAPGRLTITWDINSGAHFADTRDFRYWITKADFAFSPTKELAWTDFEDQPFCALDYDDSKPTANPDIATDKTKGLFHTKCTLPNRSGHHVIYSEWGRIEPTKERFHGCIDVAFGGSSGIRKPNPGLKGVRPMEGLRKRTDLRGRVNERSGPLAPLPLER